MKTSILTKRNYWLTGVVALFIASFSVAYLLVAAFGAPAPSETNDLKVFIVAQNQPETEIVENLEKMGLIKSKFAFKLVQKNNIRPGGYLLSRGMTARELAQVLESSPDLVWLTIPEGLRKEQIADILADKLNWSDEEEKRWVTHQTAMTKDAIEGVYFPDTYLIPLSDTPFQVAERLRYRFEEQFAPLAEKALKENIPWTTIVKIASLVQREAADKNDMRLIAGVIWNRLEKDMRLEIDATVQYAVDTYATYDAEEQAWELTYHGEERSWQDWWQPIKLEDKNIDSAVNTYKHTGLPSRPISNPGMNALQAALFPEETECLYYLHDPQGNIHCSITYEEHLANIERHL